MRGSKDAATLTPAQEEFIAKNGLQAFNATFGYNLTLSWEEERLIEISYRLERLEREISWKEVRFK